MSVRICITCISAVHTVKKSASPTKHTRNPGVTLKAGRKCSGKFHSHPLPVCCRLQYCAYRLLTYHLALCTHSLTWVVGVFPAVVEASPEGSQGEPRCVLSGSLAVPVLPAVTADWRSQPGSCILRSASTDSRTCGLSA